jgi:hypothetical protein
MSRETLIDYMVKEALEEDAREGSSFDIEGFSNFFPEYLTDATEHGVEWDEDIGHEAYSAYLRARAE